MGRRKPSKPFIQPLSILILLSFGLFIFYNVYFSKPVQVTVSKTVTNQDYSVRTPVSSSSNLNVLNKLEPRACDYREKEYAALNISENLQNEYQNVLRGRMREKMTWDEQSCARWGLKGEWRDRGRRIYYATMVGIELDILTVVLEEIYPVVDVIVLQEAAYTWGQGDSQQKPLYFQKFNQTYFTKFAPKLRYQVYDFNSLEGCGPGGKLKVGAKPNRQCRWMQQWHARENLEKGCYDIRDNDIFLTSDLDELVSREFLTAVKHCDIWPEIEQPGGPCSKLTLLTFGHKYHFSCTAAKPAGQYHPDLTVGRCLKKIGPEEVRMYFGGDWTQQHKLDYVARYRPNDVVKCDTDARGQRKNCMLEGAIPNKFVGPVGWHMMSFLSSWEIMYKQYARSGPKSPDAPNTGWHQEDLYQIIHRMGVCTERSDIFKVDSWGCLPLPHAVRENPEYWRHFIERVPEYPDRYGVQAFVKEFLADKKQAVDARPDSSLFG